MKNVLIRSETWARRVMRHACVLHVDDHVDYPLFRQHVIEMQHWCYARYRYCDFRYKVDVDIPDTPFGHVSFAFRRPEDALEFKLRWG